MPNHPERAPARFVRAHVASALVTLLLLSGSPATHAQGKRSVDDTPRSGSADGHLLLRGVLVGRPDSDGLPPRMVRFELLRADSSVVLTPLGRIPLEVGPLSGFPELPAATDSVAPVHLSARSLIVIADQIEGALADAPPLDQFGFAVEDGRFRILFERGVPLAALGIIALMLVAGSAGATALTFRRREKKRQRSSREARRLQLEATEAERGRIAREIHDGPLQDLHVARARAEASLPSSHAIGTSPSQKEAARPSSGGMTIAEDVGAVARELRAIAEGLRPPALGRFGLPAALTSHAARVSERHPHVRVRVVVNDDTPALEPWAEASLFRISQEAIGNAIRHGKARVIDLEYAAWPSPECPEIVRLTVRDDGTGLPVGLDIDKLAASGHFGMAGMVERATLLGGDFVAARNESATGTTIAVEIPWHSASRSSPVAAAAGIRS